MKNKLISYFSIFSLLLILITAILPEEAFARRGGSFGGFRSRSYNTKKSFGGSRSQSTSRNRTSSLSPQAARQKYGTPRKTETFSNKDMNGVSRNYRMNDYGGYSSGLMRGYMAGTVMSYMHWLPWYGAFWYSSPQYVTNEDGSIEVYPPTFNTTKLFFVLLIIAAIILYFRSRRNAKYYYSSDSDYYSSDNKSSFD